MWQPVWDLPLVRCQWSESRCLPDLHPKSILRWEAGSEKMWVAMIALAISTILNAVYFLHTVMTIYTPAPDKKGSAKNGVPYVAAILVFVGLNLFLGIGSNLVWEAIAAGVQMFS